MLIFRARAKASTDVMPANAWSETLSPQGMNVNLGVGARIQGTWYRAPGPVPDAGLHKTLPCVIATIGSRGAQITHCDTSIHEKLGVI
jgi:hypothetical protein